MSDSPPPSPLSRRLGHGFSPPVFLVCFHEAFEPIDRLHGFGLFKCVMTKEKLIEIIRTLIEKDADLRFLLQLGGE